MKIKLTATILSILIICSLCTFSVSAATYGDLTYSVSNDEVTVTDCNDSVSGAVTIPAEIDGYPVTSIGAHAFDGCTALSSISIPDRVTSIGDCAFTNTAYYDNSNNWENGVLYIGNHLIKARHSVADCSIKPGTKTIAYGAFQDCFYLENISIPNTVTNISSCAFRNCFQLSDITLPDSISTIEMSTFENCSALTNIHIPDSITSIDAYAFSSCRELVNIAIPDSVINIGYHAFSYCKKLADITISNGVASIGQFAFHNTAYYNDSNNWENNVLYIDNHLIIAESSIINCYITPETKCIASGAFQNCSALTNVFIPDSVTSIGSSAFDGCERLTNITIPNSVKIINDYTFLGCESLTTFTIPDGVVSIGALAFSGCYNLDSIHLPNSVTRIGRQAFYSCNKLSEISIPRSMAHIGDSAFGYCYLTDVYYYGSKTDWDNIDIASGNSFLLNATIHFARVPLTNTLCEKQGSVYNFSINCSQALTDEFLAVVLYGTDGSLLGFKAVSCNGGTSYTASVPAHDNAGYAKVIVWELVNGLNPLGDAERINI